MKKRWVLLTVLFLTIGFASVATILTITGRVNINFNEEDYQIYFSRAVVDDVDKSYEVIDPDTRQTINYSTKDLSKVGDTSVLEYEVTNNSTQYDATVDIVCTPNEANTVVVDDYVTITNEMKNKTIKAQTREKGTVKVELKKVTVEPIDIEFTCTLTVNPVGSEELKELELAENSCRNIGIPNLGEGDKLIPIVLDEEGNATRVEKTDTNWYDYCKREWANAVILNEDADLPNVGEVIPENSIESYFVWIPKYKYKLWNVETNNEKAVKHSIDIVFDTQDTEDIDTEECTTPKTSGDTGDCEDGEYMTHPAFLAFGGNGFWVGKFETGYREAKQETDARADNNESSHIIIKPNVYSWRDIKVKNIYEASKNYESALNSHMLKNTEWGAVAYLSHSIFGTNKEVTINNNSNFKTGYAALPTTDQSKMPGDKGDGEEFNTAWNTENGFTASTTGNITGVYDMSGGSWEYVAAYVSNSQSIATSGFTTQELNEIESKYFDVYKKDSTITSYNNMILGDATGEMGPFDEYKDGDGSNRWHNRWYADCSLIADLSTSWFDRGSGNQHGVLAGQFYFARSNGGALGGNGFRIALAPSK